MDERLRRTLTRVISVAMLVMAVAFVAYLVLGYATGDPSVRCLVTVFGTGGFLILAFVARVWLLHEVFGMPWGGFMTGYRRKKRDED